MRAPFFTGSVAPIMVGTALAYYHTGRVDWLLAVLATVALTLLHASANLSNDFFDHLTRTDDLNRSFASPFTGGSRVIQEGLVPAWQMLVAALLTMGAGALIGFYLVWVAGWPILWLGVIGGVTGFFYTAPPFRFVYRGIGEPFIFIDFGLLPVLGAYFLQARSFPAAAFLAGVPMGLLIMGVLWINQFQDSEADAVAGKRHWVVRLGRQRAAKVHVAVLALTYVSVFVGIALGMFPPHTLVVLLSLPLAVQAGKVVLASYDDLPNLTPANAATIGTHFVVSLLLSLGFVLAR
ncbi:MAG: 1,4-dihydroxy-2-naphthoate octaprenyltransferase [Armatimonadia bacterium]